MDEGGKQLGGLVIAILVIVALIAIFVGVVKPKLSSSMDGQLDKVITAQTEELSDSGAQE